MFNNMINSILFHKLSRCAGLCSAALACCLGLNTAGGQGLDADAIRDAQYASMHNRLCPGPDTAPPTITPTLAPPAQVFDNFYMLGEPGTTAWALTTSEGIILFDAMFHHNVEETVADALREVGLDPQDIRFVVISHAHNDHFGGAWYLQQNFGARIIMSVEDWEHMHTWPQLGSLAPFPHYDTAVGDGYTITLGDTTVEFVLTSGHTPGTISSIFPVRDGDNVHYVGYWGASSVGFLPPEGLVEYMGSADRFGRLDGRVDVPLANHPWVDGSLFKLDALQSRSAGEPHPFVEGNDGFKRWMDAIHDCAGEVLEQKLRESR